jgi:hypothetical protein
MARRGTVSRSEPKDKDKRPIRWRKYPHLFLIVCEDEATEPYYFEMFKQHIPPDTIFLRAVGTGRTTIDVVQKAISERNKLHDEANKTIDEVWAVFDKDDADKVPANTLRFENAFKLAQAEKVRIACSNEVFELWLLLHLMSVSTAAPIPRIDIYTSLEAAIRKHPTYSHFVYEHGNKNIVDVILSIGNEADAIKRAEKIHTDQMAKNTPFISLNPITSVHILVKRLRDLIWWYSYDGN